MKRFNQIIAKAMLASLLMIATVAQAVEVNTQEAITMLRGVSADMLAVLAQGAKENKQKNIKWVEQLVRQKLQPYFDVEVMARSAVGKTAWGKATETQRKQFIKLFSNKVIRTYSNALTSYDNDKVVFKPLSKTRSIKQRIKVDSVIVRQNGVKINVNYRLWLVGGKWKIYDFSVDNVSMIGSYRSQYADILAKNGLQGLIQQLEKKSSKT